MLGLFSIAETLSLSVLRPRRLSPATSRVEQLAGSVWEGVRAVFTHFGLFLRSALVGTIVGIIPGVGGTVASFLAYGQAVQTSRDRERFGHGDIRGDRAARQRTTPRTAVRWCRCWPLRHSWQ